MRFGKSSCAPRRGSLHPLLLLLAACCAIPVAAQDYGDTPYVPTPQNVVDKMLEVARVGPKDYVIDLGSGDGRMIITAAKKHGARGFGVDLDKQLVRKANALAAQAGVAGRARFYARDLYETDISPATVLTIYLLPEVNLMVRPRLLATLKPGTRIVSHDYDMGEWTPDLALTLEAPGKTVGRDPRSKVFYWVMPATASGKWRGQLPVGGKTVDFELSLNQMFQNVDGALMAGGRQTAIGDGRLDGARIAFSAVLGEARYRFTGRIADGVIEGEAQAGEAAQPLAWKAARIEAWRPAHVFLPPPQPPGE